VLGGVVCRGFEEGSEDGFWLFKIIVDHIDEQRFFEEVRYHVSSRGGLLVEVGPLEAEFVCFILGKGGVRKEEFVSDQALIIAKGKADLPCHETDGFYDSRLYDLFSRENSPCYCVWTL
jgi:hypothetical protein